MEGDHGRFGPKPCLCRKDILTTIYDVADGTIFGFAITIPPSSHMRYHSNLVVTTTMQPQPPP